MLLRLLASALATAGLGVSAALYPVYSVTPARVLDFIGKSCSTPGYLIYMSLGRWLHLRAVREPPPHEPAPAQPRRPPSPLTTSTILPMPVPR